MKERYILKKEVKLLEKEHEDFKDIKRALECEIKAE